MNFQYQYPQAFYLLALIPVFLVLFFLYQRWKKQCRQQAGDERLIKELLGNHSFARSVIKFTLVLLAFAIGCIALANPRKRDESSAELRKGIDLVIALDISNSMLAEDIAPNRLTKAKQFVLKLIDNLKDDRVGFVVFAGSSYLQMPLTFDQSAAKLYVSAATPNAANVQGTNMGDALTKADLALSGEDAERFRSIVLITDGETHDENALEKAKELAVKGVMINTIGIGSLQGATILDTATAGPKKDEAGHTIISKLNEPILQQIALATNGTYVHLESAEAAVTKLLEEYAHIEKKALGDSSSYTYQTFYAWLAGPMLLLLLIELFIPDRKKRNA